MKKLFYIVVVLIIARGGVIFYLQSKIIEQPIVLAQVVDYGRDTGYISYISNTNNPHQIQHIQIGDQYYYPNHPLNSWQIVNQQMSVSPYVKGSFYSIYNFDFALDSYGTDQTIDENVEGIIYFTDGTLKSFPVEIKNSYVETDILSMRESFSSNDGFGSSDYDVKENVILHKYEAGGLETIHFKVNGEIVNLPVEMKAGDKFKVHYKADQGVHRSEMVVIDLYFEDEEGKETIYIESDFKNNPVSKEWIENVVNGKVSGIK